MSSPEQPHISVMLPEVLAALRAQPGETIIDGTFGAGGYSKAILDTGASVVAFDRDPSARKFAAPLEATGRFRLIDDRFSAMVDRLGEGSVDGVALDLGVSSMQLDEADRGFSFMRDGPLDMRMGADGPTAADLVNTLEHAELARIFYVYGEERESRRVASFILRRREETPFTRTLDLPTSSKRRWAAGAAPRPIRPPSRSRPCASRSTKSSANSKPACWPPSAC
jgi:16S rRNA (cytosine1402-N4)-methyltransferase